MLLELATGITFAGLTILAIQALPSEIHPKIYAVALIIAALIYVGFSLLSQNVTWILTETLGVIIFSLISFIGLKFSPWFLAVGWLIHPAWDLFIDNHNSTTFVPYWYPTLCIGYDIAVASYIAC
ncbi:MAG: DUF6010 family protein, partial [Cyanobacteriota bacterium]|nr:DUF6010 family protein [Cyanobacteriota bacterium]